ncbi:DUF922 domain-containing protein [Leeuwenhoekiella marinoflava]|uniref:DUF922 domain-containing protein n=2 Tax=Leeuwenhoekiella marinoflava TaxID=988 RepID=A0A4V1KS74_9FLAO|nr:hypothetical protein [Leeuwenhoekiella marinoflava]RXG28302.1 hypothetical protein DSL99_2559 [Leeuwenhoekiella marinoflava]SHF56893.1 hypothetical protein SAMN02745246_02865 [Leeuwenhoekiella marinoflava DSM 3653]
MIRVLSLLACVFFLSSVQKKSYRFPWEANKLLQWSDFIGRPDRSTSYSAMANTGISHRYTINSKGFLVKEKSIIQANFYPKLSWYKPNLIDTHTLSHEQTHFDISEVHARMLRKAIAGFKFSRHSQKEVDAIYKPIERSRKAMQIKFDIETEHSQNLEAEMKWERKVRDLLYLYRRWAH